jgi:hypothetical protein
MYLSCCIHIVLVCLFVLDLFLTRLFDYRLLYLPMTPQARAALERLTADLRDERAAHAAETTARAAAEAEVEKRKAALKVR